MAFYGPTCERPAHPGTLANGAAVFAAPATALLTGSAGEVDSSAVAVKSEPRLRAQGTTPTA